MAVKGVAGRTKSEAALQRKDPRQNLSPPFTKENAAEMGRRGGLAAQKTIQRKKHLRENLKMILALPVSDKGAKKALEAMGVPTDQFTNEMLLAVTMFKKASGGDVRAAEYIRDLTGQQPESKMDKARTKLMLAQAKALEVRSGSNEDELSKLDQLLRGIDEVASDDGTK